MNMSSFTLEEIARRRGRDALWVTHNGKVYDVTDFADRHPGGRDVVQSHRGRDVTNVMQDAHSHAHSNTAYTILNKFYIGDIDRNGQSKKSKRKRKSAHSHLSSPDDNEDVALNSKGYREDELINWDEPLVWQVGRLGKHYMEWVHSPVDKQIRFFHWDCIEVLSMCPWWVVPVFWSPVMLAFLYCAYHNFLIQPRWPWLSSINGGIDVTIHWVPGLFVCGIIMWSFLEYVVHRWFFHLKPPPSSPLLITFHFLIHGQHHKAPMDKNRLVFPPVPAMAFAFTFIAVYMYLFPKAMAQALLSGTAMGYMMYDMMHYYLHHGSPQYNYLKDLKNYHVRHHYVHQEKGFGISSKFWDIPFGTVIPSKSA